jgi:hypothetical protein
VIRFKPLSLEPHIAVDYGCASFFTPIRFASLCEIKFLAKPLGESSAIACLADVVNAVCAIEWQRPKVDPSAGRTLASRNARQSRILEE